MINVGQLIIRQDVLLHIGVDILRERDDLRVSRTLDRLLFPLLQNGLAMLVRLCRFNGHFCKAKKAVVKHLGLHD